MSIYVYVYSLWGDDRDNYRNAEDTLWSAWPDQQIRDWLVNNGHIKSSSKMKRKEMVKLINSKYVYIFDLGFCLALIYELS